MKKIEDYEINSCTMAILPVEYGSKIYSKVIEIEDEYISPFKPIELIKKNCDYFGVSYESRKKGTSSLIGYTRKIPIAIEPANHLFFFPTTSPSRQECIWFSFEHIEDYRRIGPHQTLILFKNHQSQQFSVSCSTIEGQILRTSLLKSKLLQRIENNKRKSYYILHDIKSLKASESVSGYEDTIFLKD
ncbi:competence protein ComK [Neobacillus mesonae]|uniref:competence protein ComK n=1 Tax=Neobacillus mesonae TaxID=1193713 RepID=UPI00203D3FA3|nr:competence protein ComK [Neobacillus mesonae]MCM3567812.1 competence protein ComK [Neobacillus mesonae]